MRRLVPLFAFLSIVGLACGSGTKTPTNEPTATTATTSATGATGPAGYCDPAGQVVSLSKSILSGDVKTRFANLGTASPQFLAAAPAAIKPDASVLVYALGRLNQALAAVNYDAAKLDPAMRGLMNTAELKAAKDRVANYTNQICVPTARVPGG